MKSRLNPECFCGLWCLALLCSTLIAPLQGQEDGGISNEMWRWQLSGFGNSSYEEGVEKLFYKFETETQKQLRPAELKKVGLKIYTGSGPGLATPKSLVNAVIQQLNRRGFENNQIFLLDQNQRNLRAAGYLPPLSQRRSDYLGVPVLALDSDSLTNPDWFYESPLPSFPLGGQDGENDRKSFLPYPLIAEVDFFINLPVVVDCPGVNVSGSLANVSIWNVLNHQRFLADKNSTPVAATEIAAIPELKQKCIFTLLSLEKYQYIGGPSFHSLYTASEQELCLSTNMVLLDYYVTQKMNEKRRNLRFKEISLDSPLFQYGKTLGLGEYEPEFTTNRQIK